MRSVVAVGVVCVLAAAASAADPVTLRSLFPKEADMYTDGAGLVRLDLPPEVVADCLSSLADVRLFDPAGNEVPFLLDAPRIDKVFQLERVETRVREVRREETPREHGPSVRRETFELAGPESAARGGEWRVVLDVPHSQFVARARVNSSEGGSVFRLSSPRPVEKLDLPVGAAAGERVVVVLEHEQPFWLTPSFRFESSRTIDRTVRSAVPLSVLSVRSAEGTTVVELARPRGVVPATLRLGASTPTFDRKITVYDEGPGRDAVSLGSQSLFRLIPDSGVEELDLPLRSAHGDRLRVTIDDGDSPPLADVTFTAVFAQPSIVASLTGSGGSDAAAVLRFGGGRASVPRYDLAGFSPGPGREVYGKRADALVQLYDPEVIRAARLGAIRSNPEFDRTPALAFAMRPGASIDGRAFARRRVLHVQPSPEGLSRLRLGPEDVAALRDDLADLRIVDDSSQQWPYLLERSAAAVEVPLAVAASSKNRASTYELSSELSLLSVDRLSVDTDVRFFDRGFRLAGITEDRKEIQLATGRFARSAGDPRPVTIGFAPVRVTRMELTVDDGDDAPLPLRSVEARCPVPEIFLAAPAGSYTMLAGADGAARPSYELERVRDVVLAVSASDVRSEPIQPNPDYRLSARFTQGTGWQRSLLWIAIVAAVVILGGLTLRLVRQNPAS